MAGKKTREKIGFKDLVTLAKSGWTPEETNALLDRLDSIGDPLETLKDEDDEDESDTDEEDETDADDEDDATAGDETSDDTDSNEDTLDSNMQKFKKLSGDVKEENVEMLQNENKRLKNELKRLQKVNKGKDISGNHNGDKSPEDSLIDVFQSCF